MEGYAGIPHEADATQLGVELGLGEEALRFAGELGEHERLAGNRRDVRWKGVSREREHKESRARLRYASRLVERLSELRGGTGEIPDAVRNDKVEAAVSHWEVLHRRQDHMKSILVSMFVRATRDGAEHGPRQVCAYHLPSEANERERVAPGAAANVEHAPVAGALQLPLGERHEHGIGGRLCESRHGTGSTPLRARERVHARNIARAEETVRDDGCT